MKKIKIINVGGTITTDVGDPTTGELKVGQVSGEDLITRSGLDDLSLDIVIEDYLKIGSRSMTLNNMKELGEKVKRTIKSKEFSGIVILHGTDTMEETAFFLDLMVDTKIPVVITGSQRIISDLGFDGLSNIKDAILVAASEKSSKKGVLLIFNQKIFPARYVMKTNSTNIDGFSCPGSGPIGVTYGDKVKYYYNIDSKKEIVIDDNEVTNKVSLFKLTADYPTEVIYSAIENKHKGIIIEGFGVGNTPPDVQDAIKNAIDNKIWVVLTTRCLVGGTRPVYGEKGGGVEYKKIGVIFEEELTGPKARIKLVMLLGSEYRESIDEYWSEY